MFDSNEFQRDRLMVKQSDSEMIPSSRGTRSCTPFFCFVCPTIFRRARYGELKVIQVRIKFFSRPPRDSTKARGGTWNPMNGSSWVPRNY
jgi:hypothetical protein